MLAKILQQIVPFAGAVLSEYALSPMQRCKVGFSICCCSSSGRDGGAGGARRDFWTLPPLHVTRIRNYFLIPFLIH